MSDICKVANGKLLWKIGEKWYTLSQLKIKELRDFATWARDRSIKDSLGDLKSFDIDTPENRYRIMRELPQKGNLTVLIFSELTTMPGLVRGLYMSIKKLDDKIKEDDILDAMQLKAPKDVSALCDFIVTGDLPTKKDKKDDDKGDKKNE